MTAQRAVFLDRDGTLIDDVGYIRDPADVRVLAGCASSLAELRAVGFRLIVVSNQSGIGRGLIEPEQARLVEEEVALQLRSQGVRVDAAYFCPHAPDAGCTCRKPLPGMLYDAARDLDIDLHRSWVVGDRPTDVMAGRQAGCRTALLGTDDAASVGATVCAPDWPGLARRIMECDVALFEADR